MTEMLKLTFNGSGKNMRDDDTGNMLKFWKLNQQSNNNKCVIKRTLHRTTLLGFIAGKVHGCLDHFINYFCFDDMMMDKYIKDIYEDAFLRWFWIYMSKVYECGEAECCFL